MIKQSESVVGDGPGQRRCEYPGHKTWPSDPGVPRYSFIDPSESEAGQLGGWCWLPLLRFEPFTGRGGGGAKRANHYTTEAL